MRSLHGFMHPRPRNGSGRLCFGSNQVLWGARAKLLALLELVKQSAYEARARSVLMSCVSIDVLIVDASLNRRAGLLVKVERLGRIIAELPSTLDQAVPLWIKLLIRNDIAALFI